MELSKKIKTALDETRMLMLGAQILLGFQLRGAFAEAFEQLPAYSRYLDAAALGLMVAAVALLIAPSAYHRIVEGGNDSGDLNTVVSTISDVALLPFAFGLGIDVFIGAERVCGTAGGIAAGIAATGVALAMWYGLPETMRQFTGERERAMAQAQRHERQEPPLHAKIEQMLTEARIVLPGAQAMFGFQLSIVLTQAFEKLPGMSQIVHAVSIGLVALSIMLLMAPAAYHRIVYGGEDCEDMHRVGSRLVTAATAPLAFGLAGDIYVVIEKIAGAMAGLVAGSAGLALLLGLWYAYPVAARAMRDQGGAGSRAAPAKAQHQSG